MKQYVFPPLVKAFSSSHSQINIKHLKMQDVYFTPKHFDLCTLLSLAIGLVSTDSPDAKQS